METKKIREVFPIWGASNSSRITGLREEQLQLLFSLVPRGMILAGMSTVLLTLALWRAVPHGSLLLWLALSLVSTPFQYVVARAYGRHRGEIAAERMWTSLFIGSLACSGFVIGSAGIFLFPQESLEGQAFLAFLLAGMVAGASGTYAVLFPAFLAFSFPALLPTTLRFLTEGGEMQMALGGTLLFFFCIMILSARHLHGSIIRSLELRIENNNVIAGLNVAKGRAEQVVEELKHEISVRRKAENAMEESEQRFRRLVETMNEGLAVLDEKGTLAYVNDKFCEMLGFSRLELLGRPAVDFLDETDRPAFERDLANKRLRKRTSLEMSLTTKNQRQIPTIVSASPMFDKHGVLSGVIVAVADITFRKRAEIRLKESEEKYRMIFEKSPLGILHFDEHGTITACNDGLAKMSGAASEEFIGMNLLKRLQDEPLKAAISACLSGRPGHFEGLYHWVGKDRLTHIKADYAPILSDDGSILGGIGIIEDISARKMAEDKAMNQLHFLQTLIDTIPNPIFYKDTNGLYLGCNQAFEDRIGLPKGEFIGKSSFDIFPQYLAEKYHEMDLELFAHPGQQIHETSLLYAQGTVHDVIINKGTFTNTDGTLAGLVGVIVDITERKQAEDSLRTAHRELEIRVQDRTAELAKANDELRIEIAERKRAEEALLNSWEKLKFFAYSVVHDLKSPAIGIYGLTRLLHSNYRDVIDERGKNYCDQILKAAEHVAALVEEINVYVATKEAPLAIERVNIAEVLTMVRQEFSARMSLRKVQWVEAGDMPEIKGDRLSILRVFRNLVDNALKYGGEQLTEIKIGHEESGHFHVFSVSDNGVGVSREDSEKIFGLFQRDGKTSKGTEGAGLGLAIVKEIAERHRGKVWVDPGPQSGTTFYLSISKDI